MMMMMMMVRRGRGTGEDNSSVECRWGVILYQLVGFSREISLLWCKKKYSGGPLRARQ
jgi:hypothetical protein